MAAPEYVPTAVNQRVRTYSSPPRRKGSWMADRPGEITGPQPEGDQLGTPGPDQGYALTVAQQYKGRLHLTEGEHEVDALVGAAAIGMKRSGLFGRAPLMDDVTAGLTLWGFLDESPAPELVEHRRERFEEIHMPAHYSELRAIVDAVPESVLVSEHPGDRRVVHG